MKLARIACDSPDGLVARLAVVQSEFHRVIDLAAAERLRLEREGATHEAALRLAAALFPASMAAALALGETFFSKTQQVIKEVDEAASIPLADVHFLIPLDPPFFRDFLAFEQHIDNAGARMGQPPAQEAFRRPVYY